MPGIQVLLRERLLPEERSAWTLYRSEQGRYLLWKKPVLQEGKRVSRLNKNKNRNQTDQNAGQLVPVL